MAHLTRPAEISGVSAGLFPETAAGNRAYLRVRSPPLYHLSYKVTREQAVGTEDVKVTAMNML